VNGGHLAMLNWRDRSHPRAGGAELYCERVAAELAEEGLTVTYLTARVSGAPRVEEREGFRVIRMGGTLTVYAAVLVWLWRHRRELDGVIDSQNGIPFFSPLVLGRRVPVVLLIHHVHQQQFRQYFSWPVGQIGRWLEKGATKWIYGRRSIVTVSPSSRNAIRRELRLEGNVFLAPCGTDLPEPGVTVPRAERPRIVCVTRLVAHKRVHLVLDAVAAARENVPDLQLHLVGDGPERARLTQQIIRLGLTDCVTVHGWVDEARKTSLLRTAWMTVCASAGEGWGLSLVEASAFGVPVIALRVPGLQDAVQDGRTGVLVNDAADLADAIAGMAVRLADWHEAARWAARSRSWAAEFNWWRTAQQIRLVVEAEGARLALTSSNRRTACDVATLVELSGTVPTVEYLRGRTRRTDHWSVRDDKIVGLLHNADEIDALKVLDRLGVASGAGTSITVRIVRHHDLLRYA
jgi:glycosyltransferase involved in cell wall biosynthesis